MKTNLVEVKEYSEIQQGDVITNHIINRSGKVTKEAKHIRGLCVIMDDGERSFVHHSGLKKGMNEGYISVVRAK